MSRKLASIFCFCGIVFWLIALLAYGDKKDISKNLSQGLIIAIIACIPGIGSLIWFIFAIIAIVKICQGEENPELPLIGGLDFFNK